MPKNKTKKKSRGIIVITPATLTDNDYTASVRSEGYTYFTKGESNNKKSEKEDPQLEYVAPASCRSEELALQHQSDGNCDKSRNILHNHQGLKEVVIPTSKINESSEFIFTENDTKNDLHNKMVNKQSKEMPAKEKENDMLMENVDEFQKESLRNLKSLNIINSGDHAYCQMMEDPHVEGIETDMKSKVLSQTEKIDSECTSDTLNVENLILVDQKSNEKFKSENKSSESLEICSEKINCLDEPEIDYPDNEKFFVCTKDPIVENNVELYSLPVNNIYGKRKSHKSFMLSWKTQILCNGFAKCLIETCNFISVDNLIMREHYRSCDGVPNYNHNLCEFCNNWLISKVELTIHKYKCKKKIQGATDSQCRVRNIEEIAGVSKSEIIEDDTSVADSEPIKSLLETAELDKLKYALEDEELKQSLLNEEKFSKNEHCSVNPDFNSQENECIIEKKILDKTQPSKSNNKMSVENFDDSCIVQPRRAIPKGQYVRRRGYTKLHKSSWEAALRKYKYVRCIYQNCHFLALSIKDMIYHFGYCDGDGSFAKFVCPYCVGRVTSGKILEIHIQRSHTNKDCDLTNDFVLNADRDETGFDGAKNEFSNTECISNNELIKNDIGTREVKNKFTKFAREQSDVSNSDHKIKMNDSYVTENETCSFSVDDSVYKKFLEESMETEKSNRKKSTDFDANNVATNSIVCLNDNEGSQSAWSRDNILQIKHPSLSGIKSLEYVSETKVSHGTDKSDCVSFEKKIKSVSLNEESIKITMDNSCTETEEETSSSLNETSSNAAVVDNYDKYLIQKIKFYLPSTKTRKVHKSFMSIWMENIKKNGFARCLVATCNFISLDIYHIENHFKTCDGVFANGPNLCTLCNSRLPSVVELSIHNALCKANGGPKTLTSANMEESENNLSETTNSSNETTKQRNESKRTKNTEKEVDIYDEFNKNQADLNEMNVVAEINLSSKDEDKGQNICPDDVNELSTDESGNKEKYLLYPHILKLKNNESVDLNRIIQSGPVLSKGTYLRRRSYRKEHLRIWKLIFQKFKYIKCFFQNCHFLALSIEDMIYHFGCCSGDGSFAKFECPYCKGRVTTKEFLDIHIRKSHAEMPNGPCCANDPATSECKLVFVKPNKTDSQCDLLATKQNMAPSKEMKTYGKRLKKENINNSEKINVTVKEESLISNDCSNCEDWIFELHKSDNKPSVEADVGEVCKNANDKIDSTSNDKKDHLNTNKSCSGKNLIPEIVGYSLVEELNKSPNQREISNSSSEDHKFARLENNYGISSIFKCDENSISRTNFDTNESDHSIQINLVHQVSSDNFQENRFVSVKEMEKQTDHSLKTEMNSCNNDNNKKHIVTNEINEANSLHDQHVKINNKSVDDCNKEKIDDEIKMIKSFLHKVVDVDNNLEVSRRSDDGIATEHVESMQISETSDTQKYENIKNCVSNENSEINSACFEKNKEICNKEKESHQRSYKNKEKNEKKINKRGRKRLECGTDTIISDKSRQDLIRVKDFAGGTDSCLRRSGRKSINKRNEKEEMNDSSTVTKVDMKIRKNKDFDEPNKKRMKTENETREQVNGLRGNRKRSTLSRNLVNNTVQIVTKYEKAAHEGNMEGTPAKRSRRGKKASGKEDNLRGKIINSKEDDLRHVDGSEDLLEVKCAKCDFKTQKKKFSEHNFKKHVGLSWIEGEDPIDMNNEEQISWNIKQAFKLIKYAKCENCLDIKKSAIGFISHVQYCGKSLEEKEALKVKCPQCPSRILKYSLPMHLKLSHPNIVVEDKTEGRHDSAEVPTKRKSALKAADKVLEVLRQYDDEEDSKSTSYYVLYEKGVSKLPKIPSKIRSLWRKMLNEKKKLPCRRGSCLFESSNIEDACNHHFLCNELPDKAFVCQFCDFFSTTRDVMQHHIGIHNTTDADFSIDSEEEEMEEKAETQDEKELEEDLSNDVEKKTKSSDSVDEGSPESAFKMEFFIKENFCKEKSKLFFKRSLRMTLESELEEMKEEICLWPQLHTTEHDWINVSLENTLINHFSSLEESMSIFVSPNKNKNQEITWKKMKRFEGALVEGMPLIFTGGSILSMSWCKVSCGRSLEKNTRQYLAISSCRRMDNFPEIHEKCTESAGVIQIWDFGELKVLSDVQSTPRMTMGIIHDSGEVWDLSWFPVDTYKESEDGNFLTRLGILGAACQDGTIRIWSVCCPYKLQNEYSSPFYKVEPSVILQLEDRQHEGCLRLSFGRTGIVVGGYNNGIVAVWSLKNVTSPFCKKVGKSFVLKPHLSFQAHRTSITALSICSSSDRYITTSGLDRYIKFWDLECPANPFENIQREVCFDSLWLKHWPVTISAFEDIVPCLGNSMIKSIRDACGGKHRTSLSLDNTCWSLSFNDWLNVLGGCNNVGEVKVRFMRNLFINNDKIDIRAVHLLSTTNFKLLTEQSNEKLRKSKSCEGETENGEKTNECLSIPHTYNEAYQNFGLVLREFDIDYDVNKTNNLVKTNSRKNCRSLEEFPITSVNKVCWNPNFDSFSFLAIGYHSGFVRIRHLITRKIQEETSKFSKEARKAILKETSKKNGC